MRRPPSRLVRRPPLRATAALVIACLVGLPGRSSAQPEPSTLPGEPVFNALGVDGKEVSGRIAAIGPDRLTLVDAKDGRHDRPFGSLVKLSRKSSLASQTPGGSHTVLLPDGGQLMRATVTETTETAIEVQSHSALGKFKVPLDCVLGLILLAPADADGQDELRDRVRNEPRSGDVVWLANGDRMTGSFLGMDDRVVKLQVEGKPAEFDRTGVVAVGFDPAALNSPPLPPGSLELTLVDGSRVFALRAEFGRGDISGRTRFGQPFRIPISDVVRIDPRTEAVVPLTERKPDGQSYVSYVGPTLPFRADCTVDGHPFQLGGEAHERGIGMQSRTLLAYKLRPGDRCFQALVGVDDRAGPLGSVVFRVLIDGQEKFATPSMGSKDAPRTIDVDVSQGKLLILATEFGDRGDVRDLADWVEARLIR